MELNTFLQTYLMWILLGLYLSHGLVFAITTEEKRYLENLDYFPIYMRIVLSSLIFLLLVIAWPIIFLDELSSFLKKVKVNVLEK